MKAEQHLHARAKNALSAAVCTSLLVSGACFAADAPVWELNPVQVTATRDAEPVDNVAASISVITGEELRARGANDLRTALSLISGVEGTPGGDSGPAGAVPSLWGLREADAYLLVVDGVPWGGAFNPATPSLDLTDVARIEVLRGAAPVMFGATSFVGVIHVIHYAAGQTPSTISLGAGTHGSATIAGGFNLPSAGDYQQSLSFNLDKRGYVEDRTSFRRGHLLYRGASDFGSGHFHIDGDISVLRQAPGNLLLRDGPMLHTELPIDANYNPDGAKLDQHRYHLALGLDGKNSMGEWSTTLAVTRTLDDILRGFLRGNSFANPPDDGVGDGLQADGYTQTRGITDVYFDAHMVTRPSDQLELTYGFDFLHGRGEENAINFGYCIDPAGQEFACDGAHHADEIVSSNDTRDFAGLYTQLDWKPSPTVDVLAGLRVNHTREHAAGLAIDNTGEEPVTAFDGEDKRAKTRLSGLLGVSWQTWSAGKDGLTFYADYRNSYKPLAIDFGPEAEVEVLKPETANSYEAGLKLRLADGRVDIDTSVFRMDFKNGLTFADDGEGNFGPANGGQTRFQGAEFESRFRLTEQLELSANVAYHDARFTRYILDDGTDVSGNRLEMSPRYTEGLGLLYTGSNGLTASLVANMIGDRKLNKRNSVTAGGYSTLDASVGFDLGSSRIQISGYNLTNRRDPVSESELQEGVTVTGTAGYYRLPARSVMLSVTFDL